MPSKDEIRRCIDGITADTQKLMPAARDAARSDVCPACGALPCDWVNNPGAPTPPAGEEEVERIARVLCAEDGYSPDEDGGMVGPRWREYEPKARAVAALSTRGLTIPDELRGLSKKATQGPWEAIKGVEASDEMRCGVAAVRGDRSYLTATIENGAPGDFCDTEFVNARLIVAAVNFIRQALNQEDGR
jgi:hypothetical protein